MQMQRTKVMIVKNVIVEGWMRCVEMQPAQSSDTTSESRVDISSGERAERRTELFMPSTSNFKRNHAQF